MSGKVVGWIGTHGPHPEHVDRNGKPYGNRARGLRMILIGVGEAANHDGRHAHPGIENLAEFALYSKRQTINLLQELEAEQWLTVEERGGGLGHATVYAVRLEVRAKGEVSAQNGGPRNCAVSAPETVQPGADSVHPRVHSNGKHPVSTNNVNLLSPSQATDDDGFDAFWKAYPRKEGKGAARTVWKRALKKATAAEILAGAVRYAEDPNRLPQFTAHPSTWLNGERWHDDPLPPRTDRPAVADVAARAVARVEERRAAGAAGLFGTDRPAVEAAR